MKIKNVKHYCNNWKALLALILAVEITAWLIVAITRSDVWNNYFSNDYHDTFMDYFNMLELIRHGDPILYGAQYPAMCFLILRILARIMPESGFAAVPNSYDLRQYEPAWIGFFLFIILSIGLIVLCIDHFLSRYIWDYRTRFAIILSVILSGPFMFSVERGNMILLSIGFLFCYISLYNSERKRNRIIAYICLAIAASIKIYPAIFGLLTFDRIKYSDDNDRNDTIKETILLIFIGILIFIFPFFTYSGLNSFKQMLINIKYAGNIQSSQGANINFSMYNLIKIMIMIITYGRNNNISMKFWMQVIAIGIPMIDYIMVKERWQKTLCLTLACIWFPSFSYTYTLMLLLIPIFTLFYDKWGESLNTTGINMDKIMLVMLLATQLPYFLPTIGLDIANAKFPLSYGTVLINILIVVLALNITIDGIKNCKNYIVTRSLSE